MIGEKNTLHILRCAGWNYAVGQVPTYSIELPSTQPFSPVAQSQQWCCNRTKIVYLHSNYWFYCSEVFTVIMNWLRIIISFFLAVLSCDLTARVCSNYVNIFSFNPFAQFMLVIIYFYLYVSIQIMHSEIFMSYSILPPSAPSITFGIIRILSEIIYRDTILYFLLHGGMLNDAAVPDIFLT